MKMQVNAWFDWRGRGMTEPQGYEMKAHCTNREDADAFCQLFPKSCLASVHEFVSPTGHGEWTHSWYVMITAFLGTSRARDTKNKTGIIRYQRAMHVLESNDVCVDWTVPHTESYPSQLAFEDAVAIVF